MASETRIYVPSQFSHQLKCAENWLCGAGLNNPLLAGNMCSIFCSGLMLILVTYIKPNKIPFDWEDFKTKITTSDEHVSSHTRCKPVKTAVSFPDDMMRQG